MSSVQKIKELSVEELYKISEKDEVSVIDVRTPGEYNSIHVEGAINYPLDQIKRSAMDELFKDGEIVYVICSSGRRSMMACKKLVQINKIKVVNIKGGTQAWHEKDYPVIEGRGSIAIDRQVQIVSGSVVFISALLGLIVHKNYLYIALFVGGGPIFAGVSNTCYLTRILGLMPWNR